MDRAKRGEGGGKGQKSVKLTEGGRKRGKCTGATGGVCEYSGTERKNERENEGVMNSIEKR